MSSWPLLSVIIFLPLIGSLIIIFIKDDQNSSKNIRWAALSTSLFTFLLSCIVWLQFDYFNSSLSFLSIRSFFLYVISISKVVVPGIE